MKKGSKRKLLLIIAGISAGFIMILLIGYVFLTSDMFLRSYILPYISEESGMKITADNISLSPLSGNLDVSGLQVVKAEELKAKIPTLHAKFQLFKILQKQPVIDKLTIDDAEIRYSKEKDLSKLYVRAENLSVKIEDLKADSNFKSVVNCNLFVNNGKNGTLDIVINGSEISAEGHLDAKMFPDKLSLNAKMPLSGKADTLDLNGRSLRLDVSILPDNDCIKLELLRLILSSGNEMDAELSITGDLTSDPISADLEISAETKNSNLLKIAGAMAGDYNFGNTICRYNGGIKFSKTTLTTHGEIPYNIESAGKLKVRDFTIESSKLALKAIEPLKIVTHYSFAHSGDKNQTEVKKLDVRISSDLKELIKVNLKKPVTINMNDKVAKKAELTIQSDKFPLKIITPFIPEGLPVNINKSFLTNDILVTIDEGGSKIATDLSFSLDDVEVTDIKTLSFSGIDIKGKMHIEIENGRISTDGNLDALNITCQPPEEIDSLKQFDLKTTFDIVKLKDQSLQIKKTKLNIETEKEELLNLNIEGQITDSLQSPGSKIYAYSNKVIDVYKLQNIFMSLTKKEKSSKPSQEEGGKKEPTAPEEEKPFYLTSELSFAKILYKDIVVENLKASVDVKNKKIVITPFKCILNGGMTEFDATFILPSEKALPTYNGKLRCSNIPIDPFLSSFAPEVLEYFSGHTKKIDLKFSGKGSDIESIRKHLSADMTTELSSLKIYNKPSNTWGLLLQTSLTILLQQSWEDIVFTDGTLLPSVRNGKIYLNNSVLSNNNLKLVTDGSISIGDGWSPNMDAHSYVKGSLAKQVFKHEENHTPGKDGYYKFRSIHLKSWDYMDLISSASPAVIETLEEYGILKGKDAKKIKKILKGVESLWDKLRSGDKQDK